MERLNYDHLLYFWMVAREGSVVRAAEELNLTHPTISAQIHRLERSLGERLFVRRGRRLALTDVGRSTFQYADQIFALGRELADALQGRPGDRPMRLVVGVADVMPPSLVRRFLEPAFRLERPVQLVCHSERSVAELIAELALGRLDVVLADGPAASGTPLKAFSHPLGQCGTSFFAAPRLAAGLRRGFPRSLDGAPFIMPGGPSTARRALEQWLEDQDLRPRVVAEVDDSALGKDFGKAAMGAFAAPSVIEDEVIRQYRVQAIGRSEAVRQQFYAISVERRIKHPAVIAIREAAVHEIFSPAPAR